MGEECCVPPGFRFHPTEEELVGYYLARKVASHKIDLDIIQEVDLYRMEPWDLLQRGGMCNKQQQGGDECYFFSHKDRKYPSGTRTNRATAAGFWKATGRDKPVLSRSGGRVIGMRKTLVFYKGRAPNGRKTDWIMHEYRLHSDDDNHHFLSPSPSPPQEEGWVVCRAFRKPIPSHQQRPSLLYQHPSSYPGGYGGDHPFFLASTSSLPLYPERRREIFPELYNNHHAEADDLFESKNNNKQHLLLSIPQLIESPTAAVDDELLIQQQGGGGGGGGGGQAAAGAIDWNLLDTLLLSSTVLHDPSSSSLQPQ